MQLHWNPWIAIRYKTWRHYWLFLIDGNKPQPKRTKIPGSVLYNVQHFTKSINANLLSCILTSYSKLSLKLNLKWFGWTPNTVKLDSQILINIFGKSEDKRRLAYTFYSTSYYHEKLDTINNTFGGITVEISGLLQNSSGLFVCLRSN